MSPRGTPSCRAVLQDQGRVAPETAQLAPSDGASPEARAKAILVEGQQFLHRAEGRRGSQLAIARGRRLPVPGTHFLAHVAPEDPAVKLPAQLLGDLAAMLDGQVRDTAARVEDVGRHEG